MMLQGLAVVSFLILAVAWRLLDRPTSPGPVSGGHRLDRELARLDPWSFRAMPGRKFGVEHVVVGTTGAFAIKVAGATNGKTAGVGEARRAARRLRRKLAAASYHGGVHAVVCVDGAFLPKTVRGVRVVPRSLILKELAQRRRTAQPHQVSRVAQTLAR
jgi:hypothetical protein